MSQFIATAVEIFRREELRARRQFTIAYLFAIVPSLMAVTLYADLFDSATTLPQFPNSTMHDFVLGSAVILPGMFAAGFTATGLAEDLRTGVADRLELLGVSFAAATTGRLLFDGVRILPAALSVYVVAVALGDDVGFEPWALLALLALSVGWSMAYNAAFQLVAAVTASPQAVQAVLPLFAPISFLSNAWFPSAFMPDWADTVTTWNPLSIVIDAARELTANDKSLAPILAGVAVIVGTFAALYVLTITRPRREGR